MANHVRWGILGTGAIAKKFAAGLRAVPDARLSAVGSRATETAQAFAEQFGVPRAHASYEALADDPYVDVIYVSTPHQLHCENTILCLEAGKAVLCEKPFAINARESAQMTEVARTRKRFLMEAMWTRFLPAVVCVREWLKSGLIGAPRMVMADFGFRAEVKDESRLLNPEYGGGSLLDVGIYPVSFACMVFGPAPSRITGHAHLGRTGVDEQAAIVLGYPGGELASLTCAVRTETPHEAFILGDEGAIRLDPPFWSTTGATLLINGVERERVHVPHAANGYEYEAEEVGRCLRESRLESPILPLDESVAIMRILDELRAQWGLKYPME